MEVFFNNTWLEILGCGIVKQSLPNNAGVPSKLGWAFGLGLERIAMILFGIPDIRLFWSQDPRFLDQFREGQVKRFKEFSKHPACYKDISFWLPREGAFHENDLHSLVRDLAGDAVEDVQLVDRFRAKQSGRESVCFRIHYRMVERTMTNEETNVLHERVREGVRRWGEGFELR
jgi:phenylalanyl-tRNA synthetase alpha chain